MANHNIRVPYTAMGVLILNLFVVVSPRNILVTDIQEEYPFTFYTRDDWGAKPATGAIKHFNSSVPYVVIHHTYIPGACHTFEECASRMRGMQNYHMSLGWGDIGYNFLTGSEGGVYEGRGFDIVGIHAGRANGYSLGICLIGDWRVDLPPPEQLQVVKQLIAEGVKLGKIRADYKLVGHSQIMDTECPGARLLKEIETWPHFSPDKPFFLSQNAKKTIV